MVTSSPLESVSPLEFGAQTGENHPAEGVVGAGVDVAVRTAVAVIDRQVAADRRILVEDIIHAGTQGDAIFHAPGRGQIEVQLNAGITDDIARDLRKKIQNATPKVQVRIQGDQLRVVGKDKDTLQLVIKTLREAEDIPVPLQFTNYR